MKGVTKIFFDLDHTLWDFEKNSNLAYTKIFNELEIQVDIEKFLYYYKSINLTYWKKFRNNEVSHEALRRQRLQETFDIIKHKTTTEEINIIIAKYILYLTSFTHLIDSTIEILDYLNSKYDLYIITNGFRELQNKKIKMSGISKYFKNIITSDVLGVKKPNAKIFNYALQQADALPSQSVMIGDNWEADIMGAKKVGMHVVFCNFENQPVDSSIYSIKHLSELRAIL